MPDGQAHQITEVSICVAFSMLMFIQGCERLHMHQQARFSVGSNDSNDLQLGNPEGARLVMLPMRNQTGWQVGVMVSCPQEGSL